MRVSYINVYMSFFALLIVHLAFKFEVNCSLRCEHAVRDTLFIIFYYYKSQIALRLLADS